MMMLRVLVIALLAVASRPAHHPAPRRPIPAPTAPSIRPGSIGGSSFLVRPKSGRIGSAAAVTGTRRSRTR
jgi:hypothetical protein